MNKKTDLNESPLTRVIDDVSEGINDAGTVFSIEEDPAEKEGNGKQAVRYLLWGLLSVVVNFGTFFILYHALHLNYQFANIVAWFLGVQVGFWIDRIIVFRHKSNTAFKEMLAFYGTRILTFLIESATLWVGISLLSANGTGSKVVGQILAIVGNYILSKFFIFKNKK
ncbi:teichoic acid glycosylation protein [Companilactobacillus crustorum]|uniref:GtrA family protein n=3 Tax=Companilactobacillus TaxID=2767879 RepID=A0A2P4R6D8_9LACO|nr:GtrA family protein [Companilactobacillus crustorum]KRK43335.1 putative teichoic acid glycosylation protein (putative) [Companilactobacillus crustorum JCM 15951]KRO20884.1 putative teichoic acid glycosylation protein (putative) [Companilactobacillus crustorum]GEO77132.1 teichoic acid glycosylation protein [Companilactobacillus crustorum]HCD08594.1 GtrA family protein [Lactobacillus sp.]